MLSMVSGCGVGVGDGAGVGVTVGVATAWVGTDAIAVAVPFGVSGALAHAVANTISMDTLMQSAMFFVCFIRDTFQQSIFRTLIFRVRQVILDYDKLERRDSTDILPHSSQKRESVFCPLLLWCYNRVCHFNRRV